MGASVFTQDREWLAGVGAGELVAAPLTVFCDFDGPIMDVSDRYYYTYCSAIAHVKESLASTDLDAFHAIQLLSKSVFWDLKQNRAPDLEIAMRSGLKPSHMDQFTGHVQSTVNQPSLLSHDKLQTGGRWALMQLRSQGIRLVLVTLRQQEQVLTILHEEGLHHLFNDVWGSHDAMAAYHNQANHKEVLLRQAFEAAQRGSSTPIQTCMIGDTEADILAGQAVGIPTVALSCGVRSRRYLESYRPSRIYPNLLTAVQSILAQRLLQAA